MRANCDMSQTTTTKNHADERQSNLHMETEKMVKIQLY